MRCGAPWEAHIEHGRSRTRKCPGNPRDSYQPQPLDCVRRGAPWAEHVNGACPRPPLHPPGPQYLHSRTGLTVGGVILIVLAVWAAIHVISAETSKDSPPAACQLIGGHWDIWNGWRCG